jgi:small subunit ribosomal protein S18
MSDELNQDLTNDLAAEKAAVDSAEGRPGEGRARARRRRKVSFLTANKIDTVDYKDVATLRRFVNEYGKILPSRQTGNTAKQQRMVSRAIKRAREMALMPFVIRDLKDEPRAPRPPKPSQ